MFLNKFFTTFLIRIIFDVQIILDIFHYVFNVFECPAHTLQLGQGSNTTTENHKFAKVKPHLNQLEVAKIT